MVVRGDGTKWACSSCLKGHRVSGCTHTDRELTLVPKKGRPVTQCSHCRQERKKRSAHVKCDCGETDKPHHPKEKCIHLREAEEKAKLGQAEASHSEESHEEKDPAHIAAAAEEQGCCCHHGGKCSCAVLKKEDEDGTSPPHGQPAVQKPRLNTHKSEGSLTVFANGHHKPVHRKNFAAHECGMPYKMPMPRSHTDQGVSRSACKSVDNLTLNTFAPDNITSGPQPSNGRRLSKSEQASPKLSASNYGALGEYFNSRSNAVDFGTSSQSDLNDQLQSVSSQNSSFPPLDPVSGVADSSFDPWSTYPSADVSAMPNNNPFGVWATNIDANGIAQPALTAASSGTQSEVDEIPGIDDWYEPGMPSIQEDIPGLDLEALLDTNAPQPNRHSLPPNFFSNTDLSIPNTNNHWQTQIGNFDTSNDKFKVPSSSQPAEFDNSWQVPAFPSVTDLPHRSLGGLPTTRGPAQSVGLTQTPADDIIDSLFPGMNFDNASFTPGTTEGLSDAANKNSVFPSNPENNSLNFDTFNENDAGLASQSWTDGSMSIPNDAFASYNFDPDFSGQNFPNSWSQ